MPEASPRGRPATHIIFKIFRNSGFSHPATRFAGRSSQTRDPLRGSLKQADMGIPISAHRWFSRMGKPPTRRKAAQLVEHETRDTLHKRKKPR
jgi:hypothetical protein